MGKTRKKEGIPKGAGRMVTGLETSEKKSKSSVAEKKKTYGENSIYFQIS